MTKREIKDAIELLEEEREETMLMRKQVNRFRIKLDEKIHKYSTAIIVLQSKIEEWGGTND